jgi:hypothetical protein
MDTTQNPKKSAELAQTVTVSVPAPPDEARRVVGGVIGRAIQEARHERVVFETPGVLEALDEALDEVASLKRAL